MWGRLDCVPIRSDSDGERPNDPWHRAAGEDFVVRLSTQSYVTVFGLSWFASTGSAEECLGNHAMFFGVPGHVGFWGSSWVSSPWFDETIPTQAVVLLSSMSAAENTNPATTYLVVRTRDDASAATIPAGCSPGDPPPRPLPEHGAQPADSDAAATQIRQRHALLVDRSVPFDQKPADLLDDDTGVHDAIATLDAGQYSEVAASATYSLDELVFTQPDEAWFRYTITTTTTTYGDRFGTAVFDGKVWQITRATICQDLALALAPCQPTPPAIEPPSTPEWEAVSREWMSRANLYMGSDGCAPLSQC